MVNVSVPTNLPPLNEVMAQLRPLAEAVQKLPQVSCGLSNVVTFVSYDTRCYLAADS
jgi:hypothetical protein